MIFSSLAGFGKVQVVIFNLRTRKTSRFTIRDDEMQTIKLEQVTIDMPTGRVMLGTSCTEPAESIALAFCVGVLFLACQRQAVMAPSASSLSGSVRSLSQLKMATGSESRDAISGSDKLQAALAKHGGGSGARMGAKTKLQQRKRTRRRKMSASFTFLLACGLQIESYYHSISQPASRNGTLSRSDAPPLITSIDGDVKYATSGSVGAGSQTRGSLASSGIVANGNGVARTQSSSERSSERDVMDVRL